MNNSQRASFFFQVAGLRGRVARLPRRGRLALYALAALAVLWLLGLPQALYRHVYVWLAYPVAWLLDVAQGVGGPSWAAWTRDIDRRYAWLHTLAHGGLGWAILVEILLPFVPVGAVGWRVGWFLYTRPKPLKPTVAHGSARWMLRAELRALRYTGAPLVLGVCDGLTVALDRALQVLNVLLIGPPGTGKSAAYFIANLRREHGDRAVVATDLKNELLKKCYTALANKHEVWVLNFLSPKTSLGYNPLAYCTDPLATALFCDAWIANTGASEKDPFWNNAAREVLMAGIAHLKALADEAGARTASGRAPEVTLAHLDHFLTGQPPQQVIAALETSPAPLAKKKAMSFMASLKANDKLLGSVYAEITPRFMIMSDPRVQAVTSRNEVDFRRMVDDQQKPVALFVGLDRTLQKQLRPLVSAFFLDMYRTFSGIADESASDALPRDVMIYADEFGNLGAIPEMTTWISTLRSAGVYHLLAAQSTAQVKALYGPEGFETIAASCHTKIGLSNMVKEDCEWFSAMAGQKTEVTQSSNVQRGRFHVTTDRGGASQSETKANLINPDEVQRLGRAEALALIGELPPARLAQRRYFDDPDVRGIEGPVPPLGPARKGGELRPPVLPRHPAPAQQAQGQEGEPERDPSEGNGTDEDTQAASLTTWVGQDADEDQLQLGGNSPIEH